MKEDPRHRLISARISPMVEMARWIFELYKIPYAEEAHAPVTHMPATLRVGGGLEVPVVVSSEGVWRGAREFLVNFDSKSPPGVRLLGETGDERAANLAFIDELFALLLRQVRRYVYFHLLPHRRVLAPYVVQGAPWWEKFVVYAFYPIWRFLMGKALDFSPDLIRNGPADIERAFEIVEGRLSDGRRFLSGDKPGILDVVFSSLAAPVIFPEEYGAKLPAIADLPEELKNFVSGCRGRRAGELVLETYGTARPEPQKTLRFRKKSLSLLDSSLARWAKIVAAKFLVRFVPRLVVGRFAVVSRWNDVQDALRRDTEFLIAPVNGPSIEEINGPFALGMDRGEVLEREQGWMYGALSTLDLEAVRARVEAEAKFLLAAAQNTRERNIDVVNGYARLVATRSAVSIFGVPGASEADYMRVTRWIFQHAFLNVFKNEEIRSRALSASADLRSWTLAEIARRKAGMNGKTDMMSALLIQQSENPEFLDDDGIRRTLMGMLLGAVDTTTTVTANCVSVILADAGLRKSALADVNDPERFLGWCWDALRFHPNNSVLVRHALAGTEIRGKKLKRDATAVLNTLGAMHDSEAFPAPGQANPDRPLNLYLHFSGGLHRCAGRAINAVQVPELVRQLLLHGASDPGAARFDGPFIDKLVVRV